MSQTITVLPELVTSSGTANEELTINEPVLDRIENPIIMIEVVSGTFQFAVGDDASNSSATYMAGDKTTLTLRKADMRRSELKLNFKAAANGDTFRISGI